MNIFLQPYLRYFEFWGRSTRREFWAFQLLVLGLYALTLALSVAFGAKIVDMTPQGGSAIVDPINLAYTIFVLFSLIPWIALTVRRLHDSNHSGFWLLIGIIPFIGGLVLLYFYLIGGTPGSNDYGDDPRDFAI